jgi:hypothetical protein
MENKTPTEEKAELKKRIRALKARRNDAISRKASKEVGSLRRGIRALKRKTRVVAQAAKAQATATPAAPKEEASA